MSIRVRDVTMMDLALVEPIVFEAAKEGAFLVEGTEADMQRTHWTVRHALTDPDGCNVVIEVEGRPAAVILASIEAHPWVDRNYTNVLLFYAIKEFRTAALAYAMLAVVEQLAEKNNAFSAVQISSGLRADSLHKLLTRRGFTAVGSNYMKEARQ